ncbi:MAG: hypothetical protein R3279_09015, partial [Putridiphycobacter sp.]|nr:hypothetical protein [Putridiphycobacter sp.]
MKTVEDIVKAKQYFELTPEELMLVSEVVESEDAYEKLQYLLRHTEQYFENHKVKASDGMRDHIMEKLYPPVSSS